MVYLPRFTIFCHLEQPNVDQYIDVYIYTIHGWYGIRIPFKQAILSWKVSGVFFFTDGSKGALLGSEPKGTSTTEKVQVLKPWNAET